MQRDQDSLGHAEAESSDDGQTERGQATEQSGGERGNDEQRVARRIQRTDRRHEDPGESGEHGRNDPVDGGDPPGPPTEKRGGLLILGDGAGSQAEQRPARHRPQTGGDHDDRRGEQQPVARHGHAQQGQR